LSFEVRDKDLLGRIGRLKTRSGILETPALLPVLNPRVLDIAPKQLREEFGYGGLMTNAYLLKKHFEAQVTEKGVHRFLDFEGVVMTDSGGYQVLRYGGVAVTSRQIIEFQKRIKPDIAIILDIPTGWRTGRAYAKSTVLTTLERAKEAVKFFEEDDPLWMGPVQGGEHLDLVAWSAREIGRLPFDLYALGSPTEVMERYLFDVLVDMIAAAKANLPIQKPFHLFGAGHPFMFSFAVALGCDLFDSAAYALYARDGRYITENGTLRLERLEYFPCSCPACKSTTPEKLKQEGKAQVYRFLLSHNLYASQAEVQRVKQSIVEGRLWELLELRAKAHPSLSQAFQRIAKYAEWMEKFTPSIKPRGLLIYGEHSLRRPEILRHRWKMLKSYEKPPSSKLLVLLPEPDSKPFHLSSSGKIKKILEAIPAGGKAVHFCFYSPALGIVPLELDEVYPLSQFEAAQPYSLEMKRNLAAYIVEYVKTQNYSKVILHRDSRLLDRAHVRQLKEKAGIRVNNGRKRAWAEGSLQGLKKSLEEAVRGLRG
jgi:7-cyano-7-deazaguanine tRNA-ribosyltransferase